MRRIVMVLAVGMVLIGTVTVVSARYPRLGSVETVLTGDPETRAAAIEAMRNAGPRGLKDLIARRDGLQAQLRAADEPAAVVLREQIMQLDTAIDAVGGARYCSVSQLYWYTDLEKAQEESSRSNKPILSLRMLGKLTDEFSCANSRFFRTTLYSNQEISEMLRAKFVLHWESVRPVPRVTIDFGDGRTLERTLTGNSVHYVLDQQGRPLDALPGLYGPAAFKKWLAEAESLATKYAATATGERDAFLSDYHREQLAQVNDKFVADLNRVRMSSQLRELSSTAGKAQAPPAKAAAEIAAPKRRAEIGIIREVANERSLPKTIDQLDDATWQQIAALHAGESQLDAASVELIRRENPSAVVAGRLSVTKAVVEDPLARLVRTFQTSISLDTVRNEYVLHRQLHQWFANGEANIDLHRLNERVYAELFLTPSSDPWLGLMTPNTYTALQNNGVRQPTAQP